MYLPIHVNASFLKLRLCFLCIHSSPSATISPSPSRTPTPAPIATLLLDDEKDGAVLVEEELNAEAVAVAVTVTVAEMVFALSSDVEPDVRLTITSPAWIKNGAVLPSVPTIQVSLEASTWLQQNKG